jgi:retron-type reverse transcriptase
MADKRLFDADIRRYAQMKNLDSSLYDLSRKFCYLNWSLEQEYCERIGNYK